MLPLEVAGLNSSDHDSMTGDATFIASDRSSADRLSPSLKELPAVSAPGPSANSSQITAETLLLPISTGEKPEARKSNLLAFDQMLEGLRCFSQTRRLTDEENAYLPRHWLFWRVDPKTVLSFSAPPVGSWNDAFKQELDAWANFEYAKPAPAANIVSSLFDEAVKLGLLRPDHGETMDHKVFIPSGLTPDYKITSAHDGCKTWFKVRGHPTLNKLGELLQRCYHHLAISHRIRQDLTNRFGVDKADSMRDPIRWSASSVKPH
jgi:hypothetical protein